MFLAYFFYSDALLTFSDNYPLYLEKVHAIPDVQKSILTAIILLCASISAATTGKLADKI
jgi:MFS family permease